MIKLRWQKKTPAEPRVGGPYWYWKSFIYARLAVAMGERGTLTLFGNQSELHRLFIEQLLSEYRVKTEGRGRVVDEWKHRPERTENHWWDGIVGCAVGALLLGAELPGTQPVKRKKNVRLTLQQMADNAEKARLSRVR